MNASAGRRRESIRARGRRQAVAWRVGAVQGPGLHHRSPERRAPRSRPPRAAPPRCLRPSAPGSGMRSNSSEVAPSSSGTSIVATPTMRPSRSAMKPICRRSVWSCQTRQHLLRRRVEVGMTRVVPAERVAEDRDRAGTDRRPAHPVVAGTVMRRTVSVAASGILVVSVIEHLLPRALVGDRHEADRLVDVEHGAILLGVVR